MGRLAGKGRLLLSGSNVLKCLEDAVHISPFDSHTFRFEHPPECERGGRKVAGLMMCLTRRLVRHSPTSRDAFGGGDGNPRSLAHRTSLGSAAMRIAGHSQRPWAAASPHPTLHANGSFAYADRAPPQRIPPLAFIFVRTDRTGGDAQRVSFSYPRAGDEAAGSFS